MVARGISADSFVSPFRLRSHGWRAVLEAEVRRCLRSPFMVTGVLLCIAAIALAHLLGNPSFLITISLFSMLFTSLSVSSLRLYSTSPGIARLFPQAPMSMRLVLVLPTALLILALTLTVSSVAALLPGPLLHLPNMLAMLAACVSGLVGGIRWTTATPTQFSSGIVMTEMGPIHLSAWLNTIRGFDLAVLLALPAALGFDPLLALTVALVGLGWCLVRR
ncbi:MAG: DUF6297 family protein [Propionibacteriaceae bacterium]|nr:DUF6297 family protein [Propionibacteriaceae bacterium]